MFELGSSFVHIADDNALQPGLNAADTFGTILMCPDYHKVSFFQGFGHLNVHVCCLGPGDTSVLFIGVESPRLRSP